MGDDDPLRRRLQRYVLDSMISTTGLIALLSFSALVATVLLLVLLL